jgi:predicted alpha/beta superfamily hydrolase
MRSSVHLLGPFKIPWLRGPRPVRVYVPPHNPAGVAPPVLFMFDGQNVFDDAPSFAGGWHLHAAADGLAQRGHVAPVIVGIDHGGAARMRELSPFHGRRRGQASHLIRWIARDLAPQIRREFGTRTDVAGTAIGGSSMGGLAALYAHFHRPDVFGAALVMSPSLWFARGKIFDWVADQPRPWTSRLYLDAGAHEGHMLPSAERMARHLRTRGWHDHELRFIADPHGRHHEGDWRRRAPHALEFLFQGTGAARRAA